VINNSASDLDFAHIWYRVWSHDTRCTTDIQGQMWKVKVTVLKRRLIAKFLLCFRKSGSLNVMAMSKFKILIGSWK